MRLIRLGLLLFLMAVGLLYWRPWARAIPSQPTTPRGESSHGKAPGDPAAMQERARRLMLERTVRPENLEEAIRLLQTCADRLRPTDPRQDPKPYVEVREALVEAEKLRERVLKELWLEYERKRHLGDTAGARGDLRLILRTAGDPADPDHVRARSALERAMPRPAPAE